MNESFGARLRRHRERQHITLGQIAASTKIQASLFEGLERNDVSRWPGGIFRRSFIRAYAEAVGLNPDQICREFLERFPEPFPDGLAALAVSQGAVVLPPRPAAVPPTVMSSLMVLDETSEAPLALASVDPGTEEEKTDEEKENERPRLLLADATSYSAPSPGRAARFESAPAPAELPMLARGQAAAIDVVSVLLLALVGYAVLGMFWAPLAVASLLYGVVAMLLLGRTPGATLVAGAVPVGPRTTRSPWTRTPPARDRAPVRAVADLPDISDPRETREAREAVEALEVLTLESLSQPAMQIADADVAPGTRPTAYPALPPSFDLERRRRARA